ncbi:tetratricopeptide repeat protein [Paenibacillus sp. NPDC056722]|uniref:tetratricopeptide repeat protein n=1 Tax=Paenibacillus sp. NPDC056722 TaxID=3345924 RepID=UPI00367ED15A
MKFLDRLSERGEFIDYAKNNKVLIYEGEPASGMSTFLKELENSQRSLSEEKNSVFIYLNETSKIDSLSEVIFNALMKKKSDAQAFQDLCVSKLGKYPHSLFENIIKDFSLVLKETAAAAFGNWESGKTIPPHIYVGDNTSIYYDCICAYLKDKGKVYIAIDNANVLSEEALDELKKYTDHINITFILGWIKNNEDRYLINKLINRLREEKITYVKPGFSGTSLELIKLVSEEIGLTLATENINKIILNRSSNIHAVIAELHTVKGKHVSEEKSPLLNQTIRFLFVLKIYFPEMILCRLLESDKTLFFVEDDISQLLKYLREQEYISFEKNSYFLSSEHHPIVMDSTKDEADILLAKSILCDFFNENSSLLFRNSSLMKSVLPLLEELHLTEYSIYKQIKRKLIEIALITGSKVEDHWISAISLTSPDDLLIHCIINVRDRKYQNAYRLIQQVNSEITDNRTLELLQAVILNRTRQHSQSYEEMEKLYFTSKNKNERALIASYQISNLIHENRIEEARNYYQNSLDDVVESDYSAYLLRNSAVIFDPNKAVKMLTEAEYKFQQLQDDFGQASSQNNMARQYILLNKYAKAEELLIDALSTIKFFPKIHANIVYNNLGCVSLCKNDLKQAKKYIELAITLANTSMPRAFSLMNKALLFVLEDQFQSAQKVMECVVAEDDFCLSRVQQMYASTQCFLEYKLEGRVTTVSLRLLEANKDQYNPEISEKQLAIYRSVPHQLNLYEDETVLYPCLLEYWYFNPMKLLESQTLSL